MKAKQIKTECPKVAGNIGFGKCNNDLPRMFGDSLMSAIDTLIHSALYGYLLRSYDSDDLAKCRIDHFDNGTGFTESIYYSDELVGVITFFHATVTYPPTISYEANKKS